MHLTVEELVEVVEWKMTRGIWRPRNKQLAAGNSPEATREATERGLALASGTVDPAVFQEALEAIAELKGIGPATASAVLSLAYPERVPFFDEAMAKVGSPHARQSRASVLCSSRPAIAAPTLPRSGPSRPS